MNVAASCRCLQDVKEPSLLGIVAPRIRREIVQDLFDICSCDQGRLSSTAISSAATMLHHLVNEVHVRPSFLELEASEKRDRYDA